MRRIDQLGESQGSDTTQNTDMTFERARDMIFVFRCTISGNRFGELEKDVFSVFEARNQQGRAKTTRDLLEMMKSFLYTDIHNIPRVMVKIILY